MKTLILLFGATLVVAQTPASDPVVLTIGTEKITKSQFERLAATLPEQQRSMIQSPEGRRQFGEQVAELKTLVQEAKSRKLDQTPEVTSRIALQTDQVLANAAYQDLAKGKIDDAMLHSYYDAHKAEWEQITARHILIRFQGSRVPIRPNQKDLTDEEALAKTKDLRAKLAAGAKFADLAKAESDDTGSGENGGELGEPFSKGQMVPEFETAAFALPVGQVSDPVKSAFGYHLIEVESHKSKAFEEARADIEQQVKPDLAQKSLDDLKKKVAVIYDETYFGKP